MRRNPSATVNRASLRPGCNRNSGSQPLRDVETYSASQRHSRKAWARGHSHLHFDVLSENRRERNGKNEEQCPERFCHCYCPQVRQR
jgi:hypothetical protein